MTLATRHLNAAYSRSNSSSKFEHTPSDNTNETNKSVMNSREENHPYRENNNNHDVTTKTLDPVILERSSIKLPDLMPDNKSKLQMSVKR